MQADLLISPLISRTPETQSGPVKTPTMKLSHSWDISMNDGGEQTAHICLGLYLEEQSC